MINMKVQNEKYIMVSLLYFNEPWIIKEKILIDQYLCKWNDFNINLMSFTQSLKIQRQNI